MTDITTHQASRRRLLIALAITCSFMVIQIIGAYFSNSLAVLADAGHLFVHNSSLFIALIASSMAIHFAKNYNDGYQRAELTGGLINGILYLSISVIILFEGGERFLHHSDGHDLQINSYLMSVISAIGFLFHGAAAWVLYKGRKASINVYAVFLHSFFDLISTVSTFFAGILIHLTGWPEIDIISSMLIASFVLFTGVKVITRCIKGLMENKSKLPDVSEIEQSIASVEHVQNVHNVTVVRHDKDIVVGAHVVLKRHCTVEKHDEACRLKIETLLRVRFNIEKSVLQVESHECHHVN
ncbi:cation transporter [Pseudoalteromonas sp. MEBiC 03607]|jgi:cobalt-zinc-cadmium efflux system protein|uniref:cation diffusion facilitator family transporter n=1 Tax=unclassified Pseudoalteromonas TaxID=194690 RepID=UPI000C3F9AB7|nr:MULTISPECIES: cation diffusion facilitator family transporter [unclassified Pseudoalteromonas]MBU77067.1 zinc transporter [Pseudoalteromonadaceae bacterium]MCF2902290.1 cation diffusion facilitator family transporter [Pseudoalteromonas sp. OFAV1]MCO7250685.1 cation diffusion facilitator family transporter [Pseudoalteromonas sp. Ps84H-4]TGV17587.1 cation transporter [Pseudoalteromonas sp. MEBiC 03607]TMO44004.1 zinc transporter [Pseudoalteromonas sp. S4389]|tara:strand:+ start:3826 stop:4719 length:894 start_codon:yes stop_codon:yes gene_type:complete